MSAEQEFPDSGARSGEGVPERDPTTSGAVERSESAVADPGARADHDSRPGRRRRSEPNMLPGRERRRFGLERLLVRLIATCGIVGIGVAVGAIMVSSKSQGWVIGLVVAIVSVVLSAVLWSSRSV